MNTTIYYAVINALFYYTPEFIGMLFILHALFHEKFRLDRLTVSVIIAYNVWYLFFNQFLNIIPYLNTIVRLFFLVDVLYIYLKFRAGIKRSIQMFLTMHLLLFVLELIILLIAIIVVQLLGLNHHQFPILVNPLKINYIGSVCTLFICYFIYKKCNIHKLFYYVFETNCTLGHVIEMAGMLCIAYLLWFSLKDYITSAEIALFFIFLILLICTIYQWQKVSLLSQEKDKRLLLQQICQESYEQLILEIQTRQHEFQNHLTALQGMCYSCQTIEELTQLQSQYCDQILNKNKYNKIAYVCKNPIVGGFLYSKFSKAEEKGIQTEYQVEIDSNFNGIDVFDLIEMVGILYDNAIDALTGTGESKYVFVKISQDERLTIAVQNISPFLSSKEIERYFQQGFSTKGSGHGLGLFKLKKIAEKYNGRIITQNIEKDATNWISFEICI